MLNARLSAVIVVLAGAGISAALWATGAFDRAPPKPTEAELAARFVAAWETHLTGSWSVDGADTRTTTQGGHIAISSHVAQRPPNSVSIGLGDIAARRGDVLIACATPPGGDHPVCRGERTTETWAQTVAADIKALTAQVEMYVVTAPSPGCWTLTLRRGAPPGPLSRPAREHYCIEMPSGAVVESEVVRPGATDTFLAVDHHSPASDADLALPANAKYQ